MMKTYLVLLLGLLWICTAGAQEKAYLEKKNISYTQATDAYSLERCKIDIYYPAQDKDFVTVIWFHGGGLTGGNKEIPEYLKGKGIAVIGVGYRLAPQVTVQEIIQDAADVVKWCNDHIASYGGNAAKIVISGHSAGAYLALMLGLNGEYLKQRNMSTDQLLGIVALSPQVITHFTARKAQGIGELQPTIDALAPLYWVRGDAPAITLITGDRELEMLGRYEENAYLARMLKLAGHPKVRLMELAGYDHGMTYPALPLLIKEIQTWTKK